MVVNAELSLAAKMFATDENRRHAVRFIESVANDSEPLTGKGFARPAIQPGDHDDGSAKRIRPRLRRSTSI